MNHLLRSHAPISDSGWERLDEEARQRLTPQLAARKLVDFHGPHGWEYSATNLGRTVPLEGSALVAGVSGLQRRVLAVAELRADFAINRGELRAADRGADDPDLAALDHAVERIAQAENIAVFHGWPGAVTGIVEASPYEQAQLGEETNAYPSRVAGAVEELLASGIDGPYGVALGREQYRRVVETAEHGGYPLLSHLKEITRGPVVWAPGLVGAVILSLRGGDFLFESGQDISIGFETHDDDTVGLYLEESFSFHVATPEAAIALVP